MKKRRRLAKKLKVAVCLLSVIASTLFYAPMSVYAQNYGVANTSQYFSSSEIRIYANRFNSSNNDRAFPQTFYVKAVVPLSLYPVFFPEDDFVICDGSLTELTVDSGFHWYATTETDDSVQVSASITEAYLCFDNQKVALSDNSFTACTFDSSKYVNRDITFSFYVELGAVVSVAGNYSNSDYADVLKFMVCWNKGYSYLEFSSRDSGATSGDIQDLENGLTNGFDNSGGNASHDKFQGSVNDYETAEDSLFATATDNIGKFDFFDFQSIAAVMTGITFVTSTMTKIFNLSGGIDGMGIILSVLFSVMLVAMALGLYKRYQSTGHGSGGTGNTDKSDKGGGK